MAGDLHRDRPRHPGALFDNPFDDGDPLDDTGEEAWSLSRPSETFPERVWRHERHLWSLRSDRRR